MQERGVESRAFLALQPAQNVRRYRRRIESLELFGEGVQAMERIAVVVFVVALDEPRRDPVERPGAAEQGASWYFMSKLPMRIRIW